MIADLKPYLEYKASSQAWLGDVPHHWSVLPNRALFAELKERNHPDEEMLSVTITRGIVRQKTLLEGSSKKDSSNLDKSKYKLVQPRDIAYNKMRAWQGAIGASNLRGIVSPAYVVMRLRNTDNFPTYFHHLYRTPQFAKEAERWSYGITSDMWSLRPEHFKMIYTPQPPSDEQAAIVRFLDWANGRLERAIRAKRKVIALLNEQKQAIIHRAVTRGLDPFVPLKPSGIPWLGNIPKHWEVAAIGAAATHIQTGPFGSQLHSHEYITAGVPVINPSHMADGRLKPSPVVTISKDKARDLSRHMLCPGDIVIARRGELGRCALVTPLEHGWICGTGSLLLRCKTATVSPAFFQIVFASRGIADMLSLSSIGATMANLNAGTVARQRLPLPPLEEQKRIVRYIEDETYRVEIVISRLEREIELLREYRTRLVADVVTGKLDVRAAAAKLPDEAEDLELLDDADALTEGDEGNGRCRSRCDA